ncbi:YncE family protein [Bradyrhizobium sp. RDI18]|uniref:YncE family protein n=1 Tax=Bradyrhizobium sp. RDI18 TaxID=3367400 RepID=UPI00371C268D
MTDQTSDTLSFVDLDTMKETERLTVTASLPASRFPPIRGLLYITAPDSKELIEVDAVARKVKRRLFLDGGPLGIAANPGRPEVYADWYTHKVRSSIEEPDRCWRGQVGDRHRASP